MNGTREIYRQFMIGQMQLWEDKIAHLRAGLRTLDGVSRYEYEVRLRELDRLNQRVFGRYTDLLLASDREWEDRRRELDAAAYRLQEMFQLFTLQPH